MVSAVNISAVDRKLDLLQILRRQFRAETRTEKWKTCFVFCWPCIMKWFLVNDQRDAQFLSMYSFIFLTLYMFRAHRAHHQERQIVSIQPPVVVTLCRWPCRVQEHMLLHTRQSILILPSQLPTCIRHGHRHRVTATRGCIDTICLSWWWARWPRNM